MLTRHSDILTVLLLVTMASVGFWIKSSTFVADSPDKRAIDRANIIRSLEKRGLHLFEQSSITSQGEYSALRFSTESCNGGIDIVPLYRNTEGQHLLVAKHSAGRAVIAFHGKIYRRIPSFHFWIKELGYALAILERPSLFSRALAIREFGECGLMAVAVALTNAAKIAPK